MPKVVTPSEYLARAIKTHNNKYSYDLSTLCSAKLPATIICPTHGKFSQKLANHLNGAGCPQCAGKGVDWVERFKSVHGDTYDYSHVEFAGYKTDVKIGCKLHGEFLQSPDNHYRGKQGCPKCKGARIRASKQLSVHEFITRARQVHGDRFEYKFTQFPNMLTGEVLITCPLHGEFAQNPVNHLAGTVGCTKCNNMKSSGEEEVANYLGMFTKVDRRDRTILAPKELDIVLPEHKLAVEYCGMYWHSHGTVEDEKKNKYNHYHKYTASAAKGIRLLTIFEVEWGSRKPAIKRLLRNAIGKSKGKLMARKCELRTVTNAEARVFYDKYHPQGGDGNGDHYALFWKSKMVACMRFVYGANDRGDAAQKRVWTLGRYATRVTVTGGASRLFKAFLAEKNPTEVKSFSDNRHFSGGMYVQLGFHLEEETSPDYQVWSQKLGLSPKSHYQRRNIPRKLKEHGMIDEVFDPETDVRTEREMTYLMGARRIYDCGKKRWVFKCCPQLRTAVN